MKRLFPLCISILAFAGCNNHAPESSAQALAAGTAMKATVVPVESQKLDTNLQLIAQVAAYEAVDIYPKVTGFVDTISVDRGSHVRAGEVIIRLLAPELVAQRAQAEANLGSAEAQLSAAQAKFESDHGTYLRLTAASKTPGVVAGNDLQIAEQAASADKAQVESATNSVSAARNALRGVTELESYLQIRAPFDGVVTVRNLHPGALVGPASGQSGSQPIVRIESADRLRITVPVPEAYVAGVQNRQDVSFNIPAYPERSFHAPIARISRDINLNTRTMQVELDYRNAGNLITPGTSANVEWPIQRSYLTMFVPASAIATDLQRTFVIRVKQGKAEWVDVKSGVTVGGKIEVFGELRPGDVVLRTASDAIRPGTPISPQSEK